MHTATKSSIIKISDIKSLERFSKKISKNIHKGDTVLLNGELGVGKTTITRFIINNIQKINQLSLTEVPSPTFNILIEYKIKDLFIHHYDFYRLNSENELVNIGFFDNIEKRINIIEWPKILKKKPSNRIELDLEYSKNFKNRLIQIKTFGRCKNYVYSF